MIAWMMSVSSVRVTVSPFARRCQQRDFRH
jgi:hypothetical protein